MIYFDNAATSFPKPPEVAAAVAAGLAAPASPGRSGHAASLNASRTIHQARKALSKLLGFRDNGRLVFTANITWALNMAMDGLRLQAGDHVLSTCLEHNSVARPLARLAAEGGVEWETVPLDRQGLIDPAEFRRRLKPSTRLAVAIHASNVTGALVDIRRVKEAVGEIPLLIDTAQTAGAMDLGDLGQWADLVALTGHKGLMGPTGTGGLWVRPGLELRPLAVGGTGSRSESLEQPDFLPDALEAGTANTHGLAGLAAGVEFVLRTGAEVIREHELALTSAFIEGLREVPHIAVLGPPERERRVATTSLVVEGWSSSDLAAALEREYGIMTRAGLHCAPLAHRALGSFPGGATRFSFGFFNVMEEVETAVRALTELARRKN
ncbi:MAG: aminotransferase class V-fold PLP-dependent enzyme [Candidatus Adiutrix sp.]|nr:aminotransferase class V-fold PLP-dependent enzyme [Candidatus Adiutrix sp.]